MAERATASAAMGDSHSISDSHQSVEEMFTAFCHDKLGVDVDLRVISIAHRLKAGTNDSFRPIIVRFTNRRIRDHIYAARKTLKPPKGTRRSKDAVFISENLTKSASDFFYEARQLLKQKNIHASWMQNGLVHVRFSSDPGNKPVVI